MKKICSTAQKKKLCTLNGDGVIFTPPPVSLEWLKTHCKDDVTILVH